MAVMVEEYLLNGERRSNDENDDRAGAGNGNDDLIKKVCRRRGV